MAGYNRVVMMGNLTRDPDLKELPSGISICKLGLAANRRYKSRQTGEMMDDVCFVDIDVWGPQAQSCAKYLQKGRPVLIEGRLKLETWQDAEGKTRSKHTITADNVQFLSFAQESTSSEQVEAASAPKKSTSEAGAKVSNKKLDEKPFEEDLPF